MSHGGTCAGRCVRAAAARAHNPSSKSSAPRPISLPTKISRRVICSRTDRRCSPRARTHGQQTNRNHSSSGTPANSPDHDTPRSPRRRKAPWSSNAERRTKGVARSLVASTVNRAPGAARMYSARPTGRRSCCGDSAIQPSSAWSVKTPNEETGGGNTAVTKVSCRAGSVRAASVPWANAPRMIRKAISSVPQVIRSALGTPSERILRVLRSAREKIARPRACCASSTGAAALAARTRRPCSSHTWNPVADSSAAKSVASTSPRPAAASLPSFSTAAASMVKWATSRRS